MTLERAFLAIKEVNESIQTCQRITLVSPRPGICVCGPLSFIWCAVLEPCYYRPKFCKLARGVVSKHRDAFANVGVALDFVDKSGFYEYTRTSATSWKHGMVFVPVLGFMLTRRAPQSPPASRTMQVLVPPAAQPGASLEATAPTGETVRIVIPEGAAPGTTIAVAY